MEAQVHRRFVANAASFRDVNEAIARGQWPGEGAKPVAFRCECARDDCNQLVELTLDQYKRVRASSRRFLTHLGHEILNLETVVQIRPGYVVVEKHDQAAALSEQTDPRG